MIYVAFFFLLIFVSYFVREIAVSFRRGFVTSRGWMAHREAQPVQFWLGISAWTLNAVAGAAFLVLLFSLIFSGKSV
ncbi:hypothetical protein [Sphingopyxis soli]|uniref:hypothetical protein n=1 Tax=Sphingopyxis soli TaxID=592051 RepID=UPI001BFD83BD|nr:hypothetical protein [Sphingopyxis soli]